MHTPGNVLIWKRERHLRVEIYMTYDIFINDTCHALHTLFTVQTR